MAVRIAVDAWNLAADRRGMGRYVRHILREWFGKPEVELFFIARDAKGASAVRADELFAELVPDVRTVRDARRVAVDVVWYPWNGLRFTLDTRRDRRAKRIVTIYDAFAFTEAHPQLMARWKEQHPIRRAIREADALTTISHWSASQLTRTFPQEARGFTVVSPVPDVFWKPVSPLGTPNAGPYVLFVGGPDKRKNAATLFRAFARAFPSREVRLIVAGNLTPADEAELARSPAAFERVRPDDDALRALYSGAIAVAVPSSAEGYGLPAVEAMACGAPVIAADAAALPEACDGAAMLVAPFDIDGWRSALQCVHADAPLRAAMRERSLLRVARCALASPGNDLLEFFYKECGRESLGVSTR